MATMEKLAGRAAMAAKKGATIAGAVGRATKSAKAMDPSMQRKYLPKSGPATKRLAQRAVQGAMMGGYQGAKMSGTKMPRVTKGMGKMMSKMMGK